MRTLFLTICVIFALAIGVALGAGPLGERITDKASSLSDAEPTDAADGSDRVDAGLLSALAPTALAGKLTGQSVALVALPGAPAATVKALSGDVAAAGGTVASTTTLTTGLTAVGEKQIVDSLGTQLLAQVPGLAGQSLTTYPRIGALLSAALTTSAAPAPGAAGATPIPASTPGQTVRAALYAGGLVANEMTGNLGTLTILVTGDDVDDAILAGLVAGLRASTRGLVVAGSTNDGDVAAVRDAVRDAGLAVGTFDGLDTRGGQIGTVLLSARQITSPGGSFGASGSDGTAPLT